MMRVSIACLFSLFLFLGFISPSYADESNIFTAITEINDLGIEHVSPHTKYTIEYQYDMWIENATVDLTPETLGVEDRTCLVGLNISSTADIEFRIFCLLEARSPRDDDNGSYLHGGMIGNLDDSHSWFSGQLEGLLVNETDHDLINFPDGTISFIPVLLEPKIVNLMGVFYNASLETKNSIHTMNYDEIPVEYGSISIKENKFIHVRTKSVRPVSTSAIDEISTTYSFSTKSEVLNTGEEIGILFSNTCTAYLSGTINIENASTLKHGVYKTLLPGPCGDMFTERIFPAESRYEINWKFSIYIMGEILDYLPDGNISLSFYTGQNKENTYGAVIISNGGEISYSIDQVPNFWYAYPQIDYFDFTPGPKILDITPETENTDISYTYSTGIFTVFIIFTTLIYLSRLRHRRLKYI